MGDRGRPLRSCDPAGAGVPPEQIKRDTRVTYLREGVEAAARIAYANEIGVTKVVAICKPSLTRRVVEEFRAATSLTVPVLCPNLTFEEAMRGPFDQASRGPQGLSPRALPNTLVNDVQKTLALAQDEPPAKVRAGPQRPASRRVRHKASIGRGSARRWERAAAVRCGHCGSSRGTVGCWWFWIEASGAIRP